MIVKCVAAIEKAEEDFACKSERFPLVSLAGLSLGVDKKVRFNIHLGVSIYTIN